MEETICPKCGEAMIEEQINNVPVDRCHGCEGLWIDHTALDHVLRERAPTGPPVGFARDLMDRTDERPTDLPCPRCTSWLHRHEHRGIEIEWCRSCRGIYLDKGEIRSIVAWKKSLVARERKVGGSDLLDMIGEGVGSFFLFDVLFDIFD